jgi:hypothetical protein
MVEFEDPSTTIHYCQILLFNFVFWLGNNFDALTQVQYGYIEAEDLFLGMLLARSNLERAKQIRRTTLTNPTSKKGTYTGVLFLKLLTTPYLPQRKKRGDRERGATRRVPRGKGERARGPGLF